MSRRCSNCGSHLRYDRELWVWRCKGCRRIYAHKEIQDERALRNPRHGRREEGRPQVGVRHSTRDNRPYAESARPDIPITQSPGGTTLGSRLKSALLEVGGLAFLFGVVLVIASTVSMIWPQGIVKVVPKQLEIIRVLPTHMDVERAEITVFEMVNEERRSENLPALTWDESIASYSRKHSLDMAERRSLYHNTVELAALQLGENAALNPRLAGGMIMLPYPIGIAVYKTDSELVSETVRGWMRSSGHRQNILNPRYEFTGVGIAVAEDGVTYYITQNFR